MSPESILSANEIVLLGEFVSMDTLLTIGEFGYLSSEAIFMIVEYKFHPQMMFRGKETTEIYLWNCERVRNRDGYSTILKLKASEQYLVYGNEIKQSEDILNSMASMTFIDDLRLLLDGKVLSRVRWNTISVDSLIAREILKSVERRELLEIGNRNGQTIYGTDRYLWTFHEFAQGTLCYYDESGFARTLTREQYLQELKNIPAVAY